MMMHTPAANQGQMVEVSYGWCDGALYRRITDRSDRSVSWARADDDEAAVEAESSIGLWDAEPSVTTWIACDEPRG